MRLSRAPAEARLPVRLLLLEGSADLPTTDVVASAQGENRNELRAALCPSKQKSEEDSTVSETICVPLWKPGSLIKAPTGPGI